MIKQIFAIFALTVIFLGLIYVIPNKNEEQTPASVFEKYGKKDGARIDGNNVVYTQEFDGYTTVTLIRFNGKDVESGISYTDYKNEDDTKKAYEALMPVGDDVKIDGTILIQKIREDEVETEYEGLTKEQLCSFFKWI